MNNFWSLVGFEFKKIFQRKSVLVAMLTSLVFITFSGVAMLIGNNSMSDFNSSNMSNYDSLLMDK